MGYIELTGTNRETAQNIFQQVLDREDIITMIVMGLDQDKIASKAKDVASQEPNTWWVVWVQNPGLLTEEQKNAYRSSDPKVVVCVLSTSDKPVVRLTADEAEFKDQLLDAFWTAETQS